MANVINKSALKEYITGQKIRINKTAFNNFIKQINALTATIVKQSKKQAQKDKRTTIMPRDIAETIEQTIGRKHLTWQEMVEEIMGLGPIEISNISKAIDKYLEGQK